MKPSTKAMKLARQINQAPTYKAKAKLVHQWHKAVLEMLNGTK
jgi:hypothetical protein